MKHRNILTLFLLTISTFSIGQSQSLFRIVENGKVGYINVKGDVVIQPKFICGNDFSDGLASVRLNGKYGFIDFGGQFIIKPKYDYASNFNNGIACVYINGNPFFIDKNDNVILDTSYSSIKFIDKYKAVVQTKSRHQGVIDLKTKKLIIDTVFLSIGTFQNSIAIVTDKVTKNKKDDYKVRYAVIDSIGNLVVPYGKYEEISEFIDGYARVEIGDKRNKDGNIDGVIDSKGNLLFQRPYKNNSSIRGNFHDGLAVVSLYKYWIPEKKGTSWTSEKSYEGYINLKGEVVLNDTLNENLKAFSDGRTFVQDKNKNYRIIDTKFNPIGKDTFENIQDDGFKNGFAVVDKGGNWGIIDTSGKFIVEPKYEEIHNVGVISNVFFYGIDAEDDEKLYGIADINGKLISDPIIQDFDHSGYINELLKVVINKKLTYLDREGNIVWQEKNIPNNSLKTLNIDFMNRGYFYAYSEPDSEDIGGFRGSLNLPQLVDSNDTFQSNNVSINVNLDKQDTISGIYKGFKVYVVNNSQNNIDFNAQDSRLYMKVQAQNILGQWRDIEYLPSSWCGNSYHTLTLEKKNFWTFSTPKYEGEFKTKFRIELKYIDPSGKSKKGKEKKEITIYSNEYEGSVNPGQFWNKREYYSNDIMDPYND